MDVKILLDIAPGVTSVAGSGGKTTLLRRLAEELDDTVVLCTTTHILPFEGLPLLTSSSEAELSRSLRESRVVCIGSPVAGGRLSAPAIPIESLSSLARYVIVEADGSRMHPLKAHAPHEPVIPAGSTQTICVVGSLGFGRPIRDVVHRPDLFCRLAGCSPDDLATPENVGRVLMREALATRILVNQADSAELVAAGLSLAAEVSVPVVVGSLMSGDFATPDQPAEGMSHV